MQLSQILIGQDIDALAESVSLPTLDQDVSLFQLLALCSDQLSSFTRYPFFIQTMETTIIMEITIIMITTITTTMTADPTATEIKMVNVSAREAMSSQTKDAFPRTTITTIAEPTKSTIQTKMHVNAKMDMAKTQ